MAYGSPRELNPKNGGPTGKDDGGSGLDPMGF
jgi:hypothetical protein